MKRPSFQHGAAAWQYLRDDVVSVRAAVFCAVVLSGVFFLLGGLFPAQKDARALSEQLRETENDVRRFAGKVTRQDDELSVLRARDTLHEKTIALLNRRIDDLHAETLEAREETLLYRQIFDNAVVENELSVYALAVRPGFAPRQWELSAILVRAGKKKTYAGGYFFEVLHDGAAGEEITRFPAAQRPFSMGFYYEINETFTLQKNEKIKNIRLTVVNEKEDVAAFAELQERPGAPSGGG